MKRLRKFNDTAVVGFGGDVADMQHLNQLLTALDIEERRLAPYPPLSAQNLHKYLTRVLYQRRSKFDPLWTNALVAGLDSAARPFLASADLKGSAFSAPALATGFGSHLAVPILRRHVPDEAAVERLSQEQAVAIIQECMKVLFYRDARSLDRYSIAVITKDGVELKENEKLEDQSWAFAELIRGYGTQTD